MKPDKRLGGFFGASQYGSSVYHGSIRNIPKFIKLKFAREPFSEFVINSKEPTARCIDCGWKYNFQKTLTCPSCSSQSTIPLSAEDPLGSPITWIISILVLAGLLRLIYFIGFEL
jgi:hypothetical protein